jgi:hypothetical protein
MPTYRVLVPRLGKLKEDESAGVGFEVFAKTPEEAIERAKELPEAKNLDLLWEDAAVM